MNDIPVLRWADLASEKRAHVMSRAQQDIAKVVEVVRPIVQDVIARGAEAICEWTRRLDARDLSIMTEDRLVASPADFEHADRLVEAYDARLPKERGLRAAIEAAVENVVRYHMAQPRPLDWDIEVQRGVTAGERVSPVESAGLYVPRGKGSFPSVVYMLAVPAYIAGVPNIAICTPPDSAGRADPACLVAAKIVARHFGRAPSVFIAGGVPAIAAMAYGIAPFPRAAKVLGPGSEYVVAAKRLVGDVLNTDLPAGPSESAIVCDEFADPVLAAHELIVEAEHGPNSAVILLTHVETLAQRVAHEASLIISRLPHLQRAHCLSVFANYGGIFVTNSLAESLSIASEYGPEHLRLMTVDSRRDMAEVANAGEVLLGEWSSIPFGNFCVGVNAVLPTGGFARSFSGVGVASFLKRTSFAEVRPEAIASLVSVAGTIAQYEGFPAHFEAVQAVRQKHEGGDALVQSKNLGSGENGS